MTRRQTCPQGRDIDPSTSTIIRDRAGISLTERPTKVSLGAITKRFFFDVYDREMRASFGPIVSGTSMGTL